MISHQLATALIATVPWSIPLVAVGLTMLRIRRQRREAGRRIDWGAVRRDLERGS